jgi:cyclopropane-fatty-acyl-phospholipid synthase
VGQRENLRPLRRSDRIFKRLVAAVLTRLEGASLTLRDAEGSTRFGDDGDARGPHAIVTVHDPSFYRACGLRGAVGASEAYIEGAWTTDDLTATVRAMARNQAALARLDGGTARVALPLFRLFAALHRNHRRGSRANVSAHYDLGNDMFEAFLDPGMTYSSAIFEQPRATLEQAQEAKYDRLCRKLDLRGEDRVLEIGTGWGGFALHAARKYGCRVTTTTISREQYDVARARIADAGLTGRVEALLCDYRDLRGTFDKLVSIEMIEAVGHEYMRDYFRVISERLAPDGVCAMQAIVNPDQAFEASKTGVDFIRRYIFPGGHLPCVWSICDAVKNATDLRMTHLEDITPHYARTLELWRRNWKDGRERIRRLGYSERFLRMWEMYFAYCEGGFHERSIGVVQTVFEKPMARRDSLLGALAPARIARAA